jgi:hypothetical protein
MTLSKATTKKLNEWMGWYNWHADKIGSQPMEMQVKWLLKAVSGAYEAMSMIGNEVNQPRRGIRLNMSEGGIVLPRGFTWEKRNGS